MKRIIKFDNVLHVPHVWVKLLAIDEFDNLKVKPVKYRSENYVSEAGHLAEPLPLCDDCREMQITEEEYTFIVRLCSGNSNYWIDVEVQKDGKNIALEHLTPWFGFNLPCACEIKCQDDTMVSCLVCPANAGTPIKAYSDRLDADRRINMEEKIARYLFEDAGQNDDALTEEAAAEASRHILRIILKEFRRDFFVPLGAEQIMDYADLAENILDGDLNAEQLVCGVRYIEPYDDADIFSLDSLGIANHDMQSEDDEDIKVKKGEPYLA